MVLCCCGKLLPTLKLGLIKYKEFKSQTLYFCNISATRYRVATIGNLLVIFLAFITALSLLQVLPLDAASTAATERRTEGEVDVLLRVQAHDEAGDVHQLLADTILEERCYKPFETLEEKCD